MIIILLRRRKSQHFLAAIIIFFFESTLAAVLLAQVVINNPDRPKNRKASRAIQLEEILRFQDDGKNLVLRNPQQLVQLKDGSLIFFDYPHVYKVDNQGRLVFKVPRQGQGPGESQHPNAYIIEENRVRLYSWVPPKVLEYDLSGKFLKEFKTPYHGPFDFMGTIGGRLYAIRDEIRFSDAIRQEGIVNTPYRLYEVSPDFQSLRRIHDIAMEHYIKNARWVKRAMFTAIPYRHFLFYVHSADYRIEKYDLGDEKVERIFSRAYSPPPSKEEENIRDPYERYPRSFRPPPQPEFAIQRLQVFRDTLWVKTSAEMDGGSRWQIDVFDLNGNYIDCFYLCFPENQKLHWSLFTVTDEGVIFVPEEDLETGLVSIAGYRMKEP